MGVGKVSVQFAGRITEATIRNRITRMFPNKTIEWDKPISNYISGDAGAVKAYYRSINEFDGFKKDHLEMEPGDMMRIGSLRAMANAIIVRYLSQKWHVSV